MLCGGVGSMARAAARCFEVHKLALARPCGQRPSRGHCRSQLLQLFILPPLLAAEGQRPARRKGSAQAEHTACALGVTQATCAHVLLCSHEDVLV